MHGITVPRAAADASPARGAFPSARDQVSDGFFGSGLPEMEVPSASVRCLCKEVKAESGRGSALVVGGRRPDPQSVVRFPRAARWTPKRREWGQGGRRKLLLLCELLALDVITLQ